MASEFHRFKVGNFECISISDGRFNYPLEAFFANAPKDQLEETLRNHNLPTTQVATPYTCLFVDTGAHRVMIDTGAGDLAKGAEKIFPGLDHSTTVTGTLLQNLTTAGVEPASVDTVIITHAHPDHIGGTLGADGGPVFSKATYFIAKDEWHFWTSDTAAKQTNPVFVDFALRNLTPVQDRLTLIEDGFEIVPGIRAIATPGHTPFKGRYFQKKREVSESDE